MTAAPPEVWAEAGRAWGARATDWACLAEPVALPGYHAVFDAADVGPDSRLLDIACGAGLALSVASSRAAALAGLDASEALLQIAARRVPAADLRVGDMAALPWENDSFDVATAFNGIWSTNQSALNEAARVVRPGGRVAVMFFRSGGRADHLVAVITLMSLLPPQDTGDAVSLLDIAVPGNAEAMFKGAGITATFRGRAQGVSEWPDFDIAWRASAATGPAAPVLEVVDEEVARSAMRGALEPFRDDGIGYRLISDYDFVVGVVE